MQTSNTSDPQATDIDLRGADIGGLFSSSLGST